MTDLVERLRERKLFKQAADEIEHWQGHAERLRQDCEFHLAEIERLRGVIVDMGQYISRADFHYLKKETIAVLEVK
jgi:HAMP domain-containing protein